MNAHIEVLTGHRAGTRAVFADPRVSVGRHPEAGLRFDPAHDLEVSTHHAQLFRQGVHWFVQDLGSRNGTFVNDRRISGPVAIRDGDRIRFGTDGPVVRFRAVSASAVPGSYAPSPDHDTPPAFPAPTLGSGGPRGSAAPPADAHPSAPVGETPSQQVRTQVAHHTRRLRYVIAALSLALVAVVVVAVVVNRRQRSTWERTAAAMQAQIDSILRVSGEAVVALEGRVEGLTQALEGSREDLRTVRARLAQAATAERQNPDEIADLERQLQAARSALTRHEMAAAIDFDGLERANRSAVAKVFVELGPGEIYTATAFAVDSSATLITNRHVVAGEDGTRNPRRIAVQFNDSRQVFPATVVAVSSRADLAVIRARNIAGPVPVVKGLNERPDTIPAGRAVAVLGFPLGGVTPDGTVARTTLTAGILSSVSGELIRLSGYGVEGSSGSPVLDGNGEVIGVLYGGRVDDGDRTLFAVPATRVLELVRGLP